jgi:hypothetical protein
VLVLYCARSVDVHIMAAAAKAMAERSRALAFILSLRFAFSGIHV